MNKSDFLNTIERKIEKHHLLNHSFYKAWNAGELNKSHGGFRNWLSSVVSDDVNDYLNEVQNG